MYFKVKLLDRVISGACFSTVNVVECNIADCRSVAVLCMLCKIRCNPMHPLESRWWFTCALCTSVGYARCLSSTSVYLCAFSLQNLGAPRDFLLLSQYLFLMVFLTLYLVSSSTSVSQTLAHLNSKNEIRQTDRRKRYEVKWARN